MKILILFSLINSLLLTDIVSDQSNGKSFPKPDVSPNQLFYIQRSTDANTVIYEANIDTNKKFDAKKPVDVYWIRYAEQGQRVNMSGFQWHAAYGYQQKQLAGNPDGIEIRLNAFKKRPIQIVHSGKKLLSLMVINGQPADLRRVFVQVTRGFGPIPKVHYIELFGQNPVTKKAVYERIES